MKTFRPFFKLSISFLLIGFCLFFNSLDTYADSEFNNPKKEREFKRSIESLSDIDYQTWQIVVYQNPIFSEKLILRIIGYPGKLRMDHPTNLLVTSGRNKWELRDITINNKSLLTESKEAAAEFDITPLITELDKNRPLQFVLPRSINLLTIPPYLVREWRSLSENNYG